MPICFATFGVQKQLATSGEFISGSSLISIAHSPFIGSLIFIHYFMKK